MVFKNQSEAESGKSMTPPSGGSRRPRVSARQLRMIVWRTATLGTELAASTLVIAGIGYVIDRVRGHDKYYATAVGTLLGFSYAMFRFVQQVRRAGEEVSSLEAGGVQEKDSPDDRQQQP